MEGICREDLLVIEKQIGRFPRNVRRVMKRCTYGFPVVIETFPVVEGKPFPTLYWLTCPFLVREISRLEEKGWIREFEKLIMTDLIFRERYIQSHSEIKKRRMNFTKDEFVKTKLSEVGTGGIRDLTKVKCLHLHVADYLAGVKNPVGERVLKMIKNYTCNLQYCAHELFES
ncbi:protein of unknown function DUF501 [Pseudothermotoga lettingae TMO]|uniref:DUF501 domain-containing protein n=2 Tax=Thermotogaceae TaxID=188709 RepID=A8F588_PSELT|nr:DUF501 domain-containing protein [Pseudothermotoga lettingae]ABV33322.1 protein of unknown function DUF501 [Pseudothermotoga lettingae TMO]KUK21327.1 MAG: Uncharacterized protein XD56_0754 [Pseudothermotoga lettingae]GLI49761.1 hypothetical protein PLETTINGATMO_19300 [Pseudothermotoga lettingae TMO]